MSILILLYLVGLPIAFLLCLESFRNAYICAKDNSVMYEYRKLRINEIPVKDWVFIILGTVFWPTVLVTLLF